MTLRGKVMAGGAALVIAAAAAFAFLLDDNAETGAAEAGIDVPFEYLDGTAANLSDFAGTPVVVNFWASWCPACVAEMPDFEEVHGRLGDEVVFLGLNMQETNPSAAEALIEQTGVSYLIGKDPDGSIFTGFGGIAMPTTVLLDETGEVAATHAGTIFAEDLEALIRSELLGT